MLFCNILLYEILLKSDNKSDVFTPWWDLFCTEIRGVGYFRGKKIGYLMAKKDTLTIFHFGMNAAVWVKQ